MATYAQLEAEPVWNAETEAPAHAALNARLRAHYGHSRSQTGSKGDNNHLRGRHRSRNWVLQSRYCTDRRYGATDPRDRAGGGNWLRATDLGIAGAEHHAASRRLDTAVRAGRLPCIAEWFGSFDGRTVVGWYQGGPGSSDASHLRHLHCGIWTQYCDDVAQMQLLGDVITGQEGDDMTPEQDRLLRNVERLLTTGWTARDAFGIQFGGVEQPPMPNPFVAIAAKLDRLEQPGPVAVDAAAVAAALAADQAFLGSLARAVNDDAARRLQN